MINNRQNGRRRGRGGPQVRNGAGGGADRGNRIDNRARGNAVQLHEKYRNLARDAQTQGDRVMTEYYLQFADHYFRVLSETRARFEENQPRARRDDEYDDGGDDAEGFDDRVGQDRVGQDRGGSDRVGQDRMAQDRMAQDRMAQDRMVQDRGAPQQRQDRYAERQNHREEQPQQQRRPDRNRPERTERDRGDREDGQRFAAPQTEPSFPVTGNDVAAQPDGSEDEVQRPRRGRRSRRDGEADTAEQRVDADRLTPPAFLSEGAVPAAEAPPAEGGEAPRRRRTRRPKEDGDSVAA